MPSRSENLSREEIKGVAESRKFCGKICEVSVTGAGLCLEDNFKFMQFLAT